MSAVLLARYRAILCDLDGCLVSGETVLPGAQAFIEGAGARLMVLSNNSTDTAMSLSARLARGRGEAVSCRSWPISSCETVIIRLCWKPWIWRRL